MDRPERRNACVEFVVSFIILLLIIYIGIYMISYGVKFGMVKYERDLTRRLIRQFPIKQAPVIYSDFTDTGGEIMI